MGPVMVVWANPSLLERVMLQGWCLCHANHLTGNGCCIQANAVGAFIMSVSFGGDCLNPRLCSPEGGQDSKEANHGHAEAEDLTRRQDSGTKEQCQDLHTPNKSVTALPSFHGYVVTTTHLQKHLQRGAAAAAPSNCTSSFASSRWHDVFNIGFVTHQASCSQVFGGANSKSREI